MEPVVLPNPDTLLHNKYYWVDSTSVPGPPPPPIMPPKPVNAYGLFANSVSSPANKPEGVALWAWAQEDPGVGAPTFDVYYKTSVATAGTYSFRQAENTAPPIAAKGWNVYPNPATDELVVAMADNTTITYVVLDMAGRTLLQGSLAGSSAGIDVHTLAAGSYLLKINSNGEHDGGTLFVKD